MLIMCVYVCFICFVFTVPGFESVQTDYRELSSKWDMNGRPSSPKAEGSLWKRGQKGSKSQRKWMTTSKHCFLINSSQLHICTHSNCDCIRPAQAPARQCHSMERDVNTKPHLYPRSHLQLIGAGKGEVGFTNMPPVLITFISQW